jgi:zinc protease
LQARAVARNSDSALATRLASYGAIDRTFAWDAAFDAKLASLTPAEVRAALRRHIKLDRLSIISAGDFAKLAARQAAEAKANQ